MIASVAVENGKAKFGKRTAQDGESLHCGCVLRCSLPALSVLVSLCAPRFTVVPALCLRVWRQTQPQACRPAARLRAQLIASMRAVHTAASVDPLPDAPDAAAVSPDEHSIIIHQRDVYEREEDSNAIELQTVRIHTLPASSSSSAADAAAANLPALSSLQATPAAPPSSAAAAPSAAQWQSELRSQWESGALRAQEKARLKPLPYRQPLSPAVLAQPPLNGDVVWNRSPSKPVSVSRQRPQPHCMARACAARCMLAFGCDCGCGAAAAACVLLSRVEVPSRAQHSDGGSCRSPHAFCCVSAVSGWPTRITFVHRSWPACVSIV